MGLGFIFKICVRFGSILGLKVSASPQPASILELPNYPLHIYTSLLYVLKVFLCAIFRASTLP